MFTGNDHIVNGNESSDEVNSEEIDPRLAERRAKYVLEYNGQPWFYRLKAARSRYDTGLFGYYGEKNLRSGVVIARDVRGRKGEYKMFTWFPDHDAFVTWATDADQPWHYYEVVGATKKEQKPYFDLDISVKFLEQYHLLDYDEDSLASGEDKTMNTNNDKEEMNTISALNLKATRFADYVACAIRRSLRSIFAVDLEDLEFTIYQSKYETAIPLGVSSGGSTTHGHARKYSFHVVFSRVRFSGHEDMRRFGCQFKEDNPEISEVIDDIWYSTRQFRTMQSWKIGQSPESAKQLLLGKENWADSFVTTFPDNVFPRLLEYPK